MWQLGVIVTGPPTPRYCSADNIYCSLGAFTFYATTGSTLFLQAVLAITRYNFVCSKYR